MKMTTEKQNDLATDIFRLNLENLDRCLCCLKTVEQDRPETKAIIDDLEHARADLEENELNYISEYALQDVNALDAHKKHILNCLEYIADSLMILVLNGIQGGCDGE